MRSQILMVMLLGGFVFFQGMVAEAEDPETSIGDVLDRFHRAAAEADGAVYFSLLTDDAVFLGTDITERWSVDQLKVFAGPYFSKGQGWTYVPSNRNIALLPGGSVARFDEILSNESYGACRGTGVVILTPEGWRISQYSLTIPIPNELAKDVVDRIKGFDANQKSHGENPEKP